MHLVCWTPSSLKQLPGLTPLCFLSISEAPAQFFAEQPPPTSGCCSLPASPELVLLGRERSPSLRRDSNPPSVLAPSPLPQCPIGRVSSPNQGSSGVPRTPHQSRKPQPPARGRHRVVAPGFGGGTGTFAAAAPGQLGGHKPTGARGETGRLGPRSGKARATASIKIGNTTLRHGAKMVVPADFARFSRLQLCPAQTRAYSRACALGYTKTRTRHAGFGLS